MSAPLVPPSCQRTWSCLRSSSVRIALSSVQKAHPLCLRQSPPVQLLGHHSRCLRVKKEVFCLCFEGVNTTIETSSRTCMKEQLTSTDLVARRQVYQNRHLSIQQRIRIAFMEGFTQIVEMLVSHQAMQYNSFKGSPVPCYPFEVLPQNLYSVK